MMAPNLWHAAPIVALDWLSCRQANIHAIVGQHDSIGQRPRSKTEARLLVLLHNVRKDSNLLEHCVGAIGQLLAFRQCSNHL